LKRWITPNPVSALFPGCCDLFIRHAVRDIAVLGVFVGIVLTILG
jgi:hypothetical protein